MMAVVLILILTVAIVTWAYAMQDSSKEDGYAGILPNRKICINMVDIRPLACHNKPKDSQDHHWVPMLTLSF